MQNMYARQAQAFRNEMRQTCAALVGIVQGVLADGELHNKEIEFLDRWLTQAESVAGVWPGSVLHAQVRAYLADGVITPEERNHLIETLSAIVGGALDEPEHAGPVTTLGFDQPVQLEISGKAFCFTGDFVFGTRTACERAIAIRGGLPASTVTKKLNYLVVGGLGSPEWKHGSFGTKVEKAMELRDAGAGLLIVHEDIWASSLGATPA